MNQHRKAEVACRIMQVLTKNCLPVCCPQAYEGSRLPRTRLERPSSQTGKGWGVEVARPQDQLMHRPTVTSPIPTTLALCYMTKELLQPTTHDPRGLLCARLLRDVDTRRQGVAL